MQVWLGTEMAQMQCLKLALDLSLSAATGKPHAQTTSGNPNALNDEDPQDMEQPPQLKKIINIYPFKN